METWMIYVLGAVFYLCGMAITQYILGRCYSWVEPDDDVIIFILSTILWPLLAVCMVFETTINIVGPILRKIEVPFLKSIFLYFYFRGRDH